MPSTTTTPVFPTSPDAPGGASSGASGTPTGATPAAAATRGYTITSFDAIRVDAPVNVIVTTGAGADADLLATKSANFDSISFNSIVVHCFTSRKVT